jgi:Flp pilus assembly protein TadD
MGSDGSARHLLHFLAEGRGAFERQDWSEAIEYFNKVLSIDPNQPEAHSYMGLILVRAGHADGALMAFERALSSNPNSPLALWGKGMVLWRRTTLRRRNTAGEKQRQRRPGAVKLENCVACA